MSDTSLRKRPKLIVVIGIIFGITIIVCAFVLNSFLQKAQVESLHAQLKNYADDNRNSVTLHINSNFQILQTLSAFLEANDFMNDESFSEDLDRANYKNHFQKMSVYTADGNGIEVTLTHEIKNNLSLVNASFQFKEMALRALKGAEVVSDVYVDKTLNEQVVSYAVPIYNGNKIIGIFIGTEFFSEIESLFYVSPSLQQKDVDLLDKDGNVLVISNNRIVQEEVHSVYEKDYFPEKINIRDAFSNNEALYSYLSYKGKSYEAFFEPLGVNGWYLLVLDPTSGSLLPYYSFVNILQIALGFCILILIAFLLYSYILLIRNNHNVNRLAYYDTLTGLYNQTKFIECISTLEVLQSPGTILVLNIRQFQFMNRMFGSSKCNQLLCYCADILRQSIKEGEYCCRDSADQFFLYIKDTNPNMIRDRLDAIVSKIQQFPELDQQSFILNIYAGARIKNEDEKEISNLQTHLNQVMFALKKAKEIPSCRLLFFDHHMQHEATEQLYIETHMQEALVNEQFQLYYQPKYQLNTLSIIGVEASVRWIRKNDSIIPPSTFLPIFEENGFSLQLDSYLFELMCRTMQKWKIKEKLIPFSINHSKAFFFQPNYATILFQISERYKIPRNYIIIEVNEEMIADNLNEVNAIFDQLHAYGFKISIDHFGNGYSSLNTLGNMHIDELKFDRSFLQQSQCAQLTQTKIMKTMLEISKNLNLSTVIEGVETLEDMEFLQYISATYIQGNYLQTPKPEEDIFKLLK